MEELFPIKLLQFMGRTVWGQGKTWCWGIYFGLKRRSNRRWRKQHLEKLQELYFLPNITWVIKPSRIRLMGM